MPTDDKGNKFLYWTPAVVGGVVGARRMAQDVGAAGVRSWFWDPGAAGRAVRDQTVSDRMMRATVPSADHMAAMDKMALQGTWSRLPGARRAVAEASRASLLQAAQMPVEQIDVLSRNILAPKGYPDFFGQARQQVAQFGDPRVFMRTLGRYAPTSSDPFAGQAVPGVFFGQQKLKTMFEAARRAERTVNWVGAPYGAAADWYTGSLATAEAGRLGGYLRGLGPGASVRSLAQYPGGVTMARLQLGMEGLPAPLDLTVPLHSTRYRKPQAEYMMNRIYAGVPSRGGKMTTWGDYYVRQVQESLIPEIQEAATGLSKSDLRRMIKQKTSVFETQMTRYMMWTPGVRHPGLDFINRVNAEMVAAPNLSEMVVRNVLDKPSIDREMGLLFKEHGLFPGVSGGEIVAGRMVGGADPRKMWAYGADFPFERRPLQFAREFTPTQQALAAMDIRPAAFGFSRTKPFLATAARQELMRGGMIAPELLVGYALKGGPAAGVLRRTGLAAEELLMRKELMPMFETERITQMKLGLHEAVGQGKGVAEWLERAALGEVEPFSLKPGQQIGYQLKTGKALFAADVPGVTQQLIGAQLTMAGKGQEAAQVFLRETHKTEDFAKLFGQLKVTTRGRDAAYMAKVEKDLGIQMAKNLDAFTWADELRKNRSFLKQQMASGLGMLAQKRLQRMDELVMQLNMAKSTGAWTAVEKIGRQIEAYERAMTPAAMAEMQAFGSMSAAKIEAMLPDELAMLRKGRAWGLDVRLIGGGMEEAGAILPEGVLAEARAIAGRRGLVHPSGMVVGAAVSHVGAYRHTMGGGLLEGGIRGSMEPRGILGLLQHKWMVGEQNVAHMLAAENLRLMSSYSTDIDEVLKISRSVMGEEMKGLERVTAWAAEGKARDLPIRKAGYMLDLGVPIEQFGGASSVYVPGQEAMHRFSQFRGDAGEILRTDLAKNYNRLAKAATRVRNLGVNEAAAVNSLGVAAKELTEAVMGEAGQAMYGRGGGSRVYGATRGKRLASQFLAVSAIDEMLSKATEGVIELSERSANDMFRELEKASATAAEREFIRTQRNTFLRGETIAGQVSRHPFIGPYSIQPTLLRRAPGAATAAEYFVNVPAYMEETIDVIGDAQKTLGRQIRSSLSPMVGLAADYDDDRLIVSLIGNEKTARATEELLHGGKYMREYKRFAAESKVLQELASQQLGSGVATQLSDLKLMVAGSAKLRIGQTETAGISLAMSEAKLAMSYYRPELAPKFNIIAEMMEQQIISGKKMTEIGRQNIGRRVASAIEEIGSMNEANAELRTLVAETNKMFGSQLKAGINLQSAELGRWTMTTDPEQLWREAQGALRQGREKSGIVTRYRQMARGRIHLADMTVGEVVQQIEGARAGKLDALSAIAASGPATTPRGRMGHAVSNAIRGLNQGRKQLGAVAKTWYRPALLGLAGTAAAVMLLGGPKTQPLDPPPPAARGDVHGFGARDAQLSQAMLRGITPSERDMRPESLPIPPSITGAPTPPAMASPSMYMTNSAPLGHRVVARATAEDFSPDYDSVVQALRPAIGNANMRVNFRDNRARMTSQNIADMLEEA